MDPNFPNKRFYPGYYYTRDPNRVDNCNTWPVNHIDQLFKDGPLFNSSSSLLFEAYSKEVIKHTMLKHEALFQYQVQELHRLCDKQRELMGITKRKLTDKDDIGLETSEGARVMSQREFRVANLGWLKYANKYKSVPASENSTLSSREAKCTQMGPDQAQTESSLADSNLLVPKCKKYGKKVLDLSLPAEEYVDSEGESIEEEKILNAPQKPSNPIKISDIASSGDIKPIIGSCGSKSVSKEDVFPPHSFSRKNVLIVDLNEPIGGTGSDELGGVGTKYREILFENTREKTKSCNQVMSEEVAIQDKKGKQKKWLSYDDRAGQSGCNSNSFQQYLLSRKLHTSSESPQMEPKQAREFPKSYLSDQVNKKPSGERENVVLQSTAKTHDVSDSRHSELVSKSCINTADKLVPRSDVVKSADSSALLSQRRPIVLALPCIGSPLYKSGSFRGRPVAAIGKFQPSESLKRRPKLEGVDSLLDKMCDDSLSKLPKVCGPSGSFDRSEIKEHKQDSSTNDPKIQNSMHSNSATASTSPNMSVSLTEKEVLDFTGGKPWVQPKAAYVERTYEGGQDSTCVESGRLVLSECTRNRDSKKIEATNCSINKRGFEFLSNDKPCVTNNPCSPHANLALANSSKDKYFEKSKKYGERDMKLACVRASNSRKQLIGSDRAVENGIDNKVSCFRNQIDLNSFMNEDESSPATKKHQDVPISPENDEPFPPRGESDETQVETSQLSANEGIDVQEIQAKIAALTIVSISSSAILTCLENTTSEPSKASQSDSLNWFAEVVCSMTGDLENNLAVLSGMENPGYEKFLSKEIDYFEMMTLMLPEDKVEERWSKSMHHKQEELGASLFSTQPRKYRTRKARQGRDYKREGGTRQRTALSNCAGKSRWTGGRRSSRLAASSPTGSIMHTELNQRKINTILGFEEIGLIGWGKVPKRPRGLRIPVSDTS